MNIFLLAILAHLLSDFVLQPKGMIDLKRNNCLKGYFFHGVIVFLTLVLLSWFFNLRLVLLYSFLVTAVHLIVDWAKEGLLRLKTGPVFELNLFFIDQLLHFSAIYLIGMRVFGPSLFTVFTELEQPVFLESARLQEVIASPHLLYLLIFYIVVIFAGAVMLEKLLKILNYQGGDNHLPSGRYIGMVERALILTLVVFGSVSSLALVLAAKSLARFAKLSDQQFAEYYLFGTLNSMLIALIAGLILRQLLIIA